LINFKFARGAKKAAIVTEIYNRIAIKSCAILQ